MKQIQRVNLFSLLMVMALAACSAKVDNGGYVIDAPIKDQLTVGKTTKDEVREKLGSPSSQSSFGNETWYYVTNRKEAMAFLKPEIVKQDVTQIEFDASGVVSAVQTYDKKDAKEFAMDKHTTPTEGHTLGFFEQILGNIGRFNAPGGQDTIAPGRKAGGY